MASAAQPLGPAAIAPVAGSCYNRAACNAIGQSIPRAPTGPCVASIGRAPTGPLAAVPIGQSIPRAPTGQLGAPIGQSIQQAPTGGLAYNNNALPPALQAPVPSAPQAQQVQVQQLQQILNAFEVSIAEANDLVVLEDYEIVMIVDDSGSMSLSAAPPGQRVLGQVSRSRWDELKETVSLIVDLGACFDRSGLDLFFLNKGTIPGVKSSQDPRLLQAFSGGPSGGTPLTQTLRKVAEVCGGEKPVLLFIFTDGQPNGGVDAFEKELKRLVTKKSTPHNFRVQIMACTGDDEVGYLNDIDEKFGKIDVTDDYFSEMQEVLKKARVRNRFTRGDWCMKAMLGPVSAKFDAWDETGKKKCRRHCDDSDCESEHSHECACSIS